MTKNYEKKVGELKEIVQTIENGNIGLDESLALYERGTALIKECETILEEAELKVSQLGRE